MKEEKSQTQTWGTKEAPLKSWFGMENGRMSQSLAEKEGDGAPGRGHFCALSPPPPHIPALLLLHPQMGPTPDWG